MTTMAQAGYNTLLGMGTVFSVLILMSVIIYCFRFLPYIIGFFSAMINRIKNIIFSSSEAKCEPAADEQVNVKDESDDLELVAVIAAAIAADTSMPPESFVVRSVKRRI